MKQAIVVRKDLKLSKGKLSAQVAHASLSSYRKTGKKEAQMWELEGQKKVVLKAESADKLLDLFAEAKKEKIPCALIKDAGRTEIPSGTITCVGIGPATDEEINKLTGHLKLY